MTALAACAGRTVEHLIRIGMCEALDKTALLGSGLRMLLPRIPLEPARASLAPEYILFDLTGRRLGIIPAPVGPLSFGANQPTLFLLRERS